MLKHILVLLFALASSLKVYVYEQPEMQWTSYCRDDAKERAEWLVGSKHGDDYLFAQRMLEPHPWKTSNPDEADLFVVPITLPYAIRYAHDNLCHGYSRDKLFAGAAAVLQNSTHFQRSNGTDHLVLGTHWYMGAALNRIEKKLLANMIVGHMEAKHPNHAWRCALVSPYTTPYWDRTDMIALREVESADIPCPENTDCLTYYKTLWISPLQASIIPAAQRPYMFFFRGQIDGRAGYGSRRAACLALQGVTGPNTCVSSSEKGHSVLHRDCPSVLEALTWAKQNPGVIEDADALSSDNNTTDMFKYSLQSCTSVSGSILGYLLGLAHSRFCLMIRGDTPTSNRLYDCIRYSSIPVILSNLIKDVGLPFQDIVPWEEFAFFVPEHLPTQNLTARLQEIANTPVEEIDRRRVIMARYAPDVLWMTEGTRVPENILNTAYNDCIASNKGERN